jgi:hypothetical protein
VALLARGEAGLDGAVRDVERAGGVALPIPADVADPDQVEAAAAQAEQALGPIDVWVNVAFTSVFAPQFDWVLSRLPKPAQPVPPIYQPEVAAHGVLYAADHPERREYWVGGSTAATLAANAVAPGLLDRYLARTGFSSQQDDRPEPLSHPVNLWKPADGLSGHDYTAHGSFDGQAKPRSVQLWASQHHGLLGGAVLGLAGAAAATAPWPAQAPVSTWPPRPASPPARSTS